MILIVTSKHDPTSDLVIAELLRKGAAFERFNTEDFPHSVICSVEIDCQSFNASLSLPLDRQVWLNSVKSIYYRRPAEFELDPALAFNEARIFARNECRSTIGGLWTALSCLWVNHPERNHAAGFKIQQLLVASKMGFQIPQTLVTNDPQKVRAFFQACGNSIVAKSLHNGTVKYEDGTLLIYTTRLLEHHMEYIDSVTYAPCLFQEYIPKKVELRVTIVGNQVFAAEIHSQNSLRTKDDWRRYDLPNTPHLPHQLPQELAQLCIDLTRKFGLHFGAIDLILTPDGRYVFLELNPNGQWGWIEGLTGLSISSAIADLLIAG